MAGECDGNCRQEGAPWCPAKDDCSNFPSPCPDLDQGWYGGNATHMPTEFHPPDDNRHEADRIYPNNITSAYL